MAPADSTSSPRDHAADANPELARKKQRLSEDRGASPTGSIIIEVDDPEDINDAAMDNAIEIEDGLNNSFGNYSDDFRTFSGDLQAPVDCIRRVLEHIQGRFYMRIDDFIAFAQVLRDHCELRLDESSEWHQHYLEDEVEFFQTLLVLSLTMLRTGDLVDLRQKFDMVAVKLALCNLVFGLGTICRRIIPSIPDIIKTTLSRRDSAHTSTRQHTIEALHYLALAAQVVSWDDAPALITIARCYRPDDPDLADSLRSIRQEFSSEQVVSSLAAVIRMLSGAMRDIKDSWSSLQRALMLFKTAAGSGHDIGQYPKADMESVMEIINACILPTIREKHPRALPDKFHEMILFWGSETLRQHVRLVDQRAAGTAYQLFISSPSDALITEAVDEHSIADRLQQASSGSQENLARLFADSWVMQTAKTYLRSDIMDIRIIGLSALEKRLVDIFNDHKSNVEGMEHPVIQHAVKFMRKNEIIPYIFGPESRAGLLNKSVDVVTFLAATSTYTDAETDVIWRACSTNVEADFVKASFDVLTKIVEFLDFERLLYIARKYSTSPINSFGVDALEFLPRLLQQVQIKSCYTTAPPTERLAIGFVGVEILRSANRNSPSRTRDKLRRSALNEIVRLASHPFSPEDRLQVYKLCTPEILEQTEQATTSIDVLNTLLPRSPQSLEAEPLLRLLPVSAAVDELCRFVERCKQKQVHGSDYGAIMARLDCLGRLILLSSVTPESSTQDHLFQYLFGESAFSNEARDAAWQKFSTIACASTSSPILRRLFHTYMKEYVASLPSEIATQGLIDLVLRFLRSNLLEGVDGEYGTRLLSHPLWKALVRFAITAPAKSVISASVNAILDLLFALPNESNIISAAATARCHHAFVSEHLACLSTLKDTIVEHQRPSDLLGFKIALNILEHALSRSQQHVLDNKVPSEPATLTLEGTSDSAEGITFIAQVYATGTEPKLIQVQAKHSAKVSELLARLPSFTSATENRIIAGGVEVTDVPHKTLLEVGVQQSGVVHIRPKFSVDFDLDSTLTHPGPVEQALLSQYSILEGFLDAPYELACSTRGLLQQIRIPAEARFRVVSSSAPADDLFPRDREQRAFFSLFILQTHLNDFARLGVADRAFILRATRLLTNFLLDEEREFNPPLVLDALQKLCFVLRERPQSDQELEYFEKSAELSSRLIQLLFQAKSLPTSEPPLVELRNELVAATYSAVILACQRSNAVWEAFTEDGAIVQLHGHLLIDADVNFADKVSRTLENVLHDEDISRERVEFYWQVLYPSLADALSNSYLSGSYFRLINKVLDHLGSLGCEESWISQLVEELCSKVFAYQHLESPPLLTDDIAMLGLLRLFSKAVGVLKKKQKSSRLLAGLSSKLCSHFLFPSDDPQLRPLVREETRAIVYDLVKTTCTMQTDYDDLVANCTNAVKGSVRIINAAFPGMADWIRPARNASGLSNLGMTCYMNSLLQQLFGNLQFRKFIIDQAIVNEEKQATLVEVQQLFANMQDSIDPRAETGRLATVLNVQVGVQDDVHTFYTTLLSRLEESMPDGESKQKLNSFFTGKSVTQIRGGCGHVSSKEEPFTELSITVKNKASLHESLDEFVQGEPLEGANKYMCMNCGTGSEGLLVNAMRRTCLDSVPNSLTLCLKRFAFENILDGENKVNDRFEFPAEIDMSRYKRNHLEDPHEQSEPDMFELVGVIVHQGSLSYGHYWSYVRVPTVQNIRQFPWMVLEDSKYVPCTHGIQEVQENCFGGLQWSDGSERPDNAYVLFYQRKSYIAEADRLNIVDMTHQREYQVLPKIGLPDSIHASVNTMNDWRVRIANMFQDQFAGFIQWVLHRYPEVVQVRRNAISALEETDPQRLELGSADDELDNRMGELITTYILRVFIPEPHCEERIEQLIRLVLNAVHSKPAIATQICHCFTEDDFGFATIIRLSSGKVRSQLLHFFFSCLMVMRQDNPEGYEHAAMSFITLHSGFLANRIDFYHKAWREYLGVAAMFARTGVEETGTVLDSGYLQWIFDVLFVLYEPKSKMRHQALWKLCRNNFVDRTALYEFLHDLLDGPFVDLSEFSTDSNRSGRVRTARGWQLWEHEANSIVTRSGKADRNTGLLIDLGVHQCIKPLPSDWKEYAPGKLIGLLVGEKTHHAMSGRIGDLMRIQVDLEDRELDPLLYMTLHILLQMPKVDEDGERCGALMAILCTNIILWQNRERRSLLFFREAYALAPGAVVRFFWKWANQFLVANKQADRQLATDTLKETIFGSPPLQDDIIEALRIAGTRCFVKKCEKALKTAYGRGENRAIYEPMITALRDACDYLRDLKEAIEKRTEEGVEIAAGVAIEYEETKTMIMAAGRIPDSFRDWKSVTALPTRSLGVRQSVEVEDSEELDTDADGEDDFSELSETDLT